MNRDLLIGLFIHSLLFTFAHEAVASCPGLRAPNNGRISGSCSTRRPLDICSFECYKGYRLQGRATLQCLSNLRWSAEEPTCVQITCPAMERFTNDGKLIVRCLSAQLGNWCGITCPKGFRVKGAAVVTCTENGSWSTTLGTCEEILCPNLESEVKINSSLSLSGDCKLAKPGDTCKIGCSDKMKLIGSDSVTCQENGTWSDAVGNCEEIKCPAILKSTNVDKFTEGCISGTVGNICKITCKQQFRLKGTHQVKCDDDGSWSDDIGICEEIICPKLESPGKGKLSGYCDKANPGRICAISCDERAVLKGLPSATCTLAGVWSNDLGICEDLKCPKIERTDNVAALSEGCDSGVIGATCKIACSRHFKVKGAEDIKCGNDGVWSDSLGICEEIFCPNLERSGKEQLNGECSGARPGDTCSILCDKPTVLKGLPSASCTNAGVWTNDIGVCEDRLSSVTCTVSTTLVKIGKWSDATGKCEFSE